LLDKGVRSCKLIIIQKLLADKKSSCKSIKSYRDQKLEDCDGVELMFFLINHRDIPNKINELDNVCGIERSFKMLELPL
jgi:hypothetical protein